MQTLTLGGSTTGNISLLPQNANGLAGVGVGTTNPQGLFEVNGARTGKALAIFQSNR